MRDNDKKGATSLPTSEEISVGDSLDERCAVGHFLGRTLAEAQKLFREKYDYYGEDLVYMGPRAFCFYIDAAIAYVVSDGADGDPDAVNSFCGMLEMRLKHDGAEIKPAFTRLRAAIEAILQGFDRYQCDPLIYGDLESRYRSLHERMAD